MNWRACFWCRCCGRAWRSPRVGAATRCRAAGHRRYGRSGARQVNGIAGTFILDTGAAQTVVTPDAVNHFGLALDEWTATTMRGVGGIERRRNADPRSVELGGVDTASAKPRAGLDIARGDVAAGHGGRPARWTDCLGRDFLSLFDLDLDFPGRTLTLYDVHGCAGRFLPWTEAVSVRSGGEPDRKRAGGAGRTGWRSVAGVVGLRRQPDIGRRARHGPAWSGSGTVARGSQPDRQRHGTAYRHGVATSV